MPSTCPTTSAPYEGSRSLAGDGDQPLQRRQLVGIVTLQLRQQCGDAGISVLAYPLRDVLLCPNEIRQPTELYRYRCAGLVPAAALPKLGHPGDIFAIDQPGECI